MICRYEIIIYWSSVDGEFVAEAPEGPTVCEPFTS